MAKRSGFNFENNGFPGGVAAAIAIRLCSVSAWAYRLCEASHNVYAHADTEKKRLAIEKASDPNGPLKEHLDTERFIVSDEEKLKRLYGLR